MYKHGKVPQMAAFLLNRAGGGSMNGVKLLKLLYLADRESLNRYGHPISGDQMVSTRQGPALLNASELISGYRASGAEQWEQWIEARENHEVRLRRPFTREAADLLSIAAIETLRSVWSDFGHMDHLELVEYSKTRCAEWTDPGNSVTPIPVRRVFAALGKQVGEAKILDDELQVQRRFDELFAGS